MRRKILILINLFAVICFGAYSSNYADCSEIALYSCSQSQNINSQLSPAVSLESDSLKNAFPASTQGRAFLPVYDHYQKQIGLKLRSEIHSEGDFHRGVQAYLVRETEDGTIQVLRQKRSDKVDIAKGKYDQSLATQELPQDKGNSQNTLKRGLLEELGINENEVEIMRVGDDGWLRVYKKYSEDAALYNREFVSLFLVKLKTNRQIHTSNPKIAGTEWVNWDDYVKDLLKNRDQYTKTGSFYVLDPLMRNQTEEALKTFIKGEKKSLLPVRRVCFYSYDDRYDISSYIDWENNPVINIFDKETGQLQTLEDVISFNFIEDKDIEHVKIVFITKDFNMSVWENGRITALGKQGDENSLQFIESIMDRFKNVIGEMENRDITQSERDIIEDTKVRFAHTLNLVRAKTLAGMLRLPDWAMDQNNDFRLTGTPLTGDIEILALPGTFDPPHFAHIDRLLHAVAYGVEGQMTAPKTVLSFIAPVGENAPSPEITAVWKEKKTDAVDRHEMSKVLTDIFSPLVKTSMLSLEHPDSFGTENALRLIENIQKLQVPGSGTITFTLVCGSDTFIRWQKNFDSLFSDFNLKNPRVKLRIIVFNSQNEKFDIKTLPQSKVPVTFFADLMPFNDSSTGYHSTLFREENNFNLLPVSLQAYIKNHRLYDKQNRFEQNFLNEFMFSKDAVGVSI